MNATRYFSLTLLLSLLSNAPCFSMDRGEPSLPTDEEIEAIVSECQCNPYSEPFTFDTEGMDPIDALLWRAVAGGNEDGVGQALADRADPNATNPQVNTVYKLYDRQGTFCLLQGHSAFHVALELGRPRIAARLLRSGASLEKCTAGGRSPLCSAVHHCRYCPVSMKLLLAWGAKANERGENGISPLYAACSIRGEAGDDAVRALLGAGADPNLEARFMVADKEVCRPPLLQAGDGAAAILCADPRTDLHCRDEAGQDVFSFPRSSEGKKAIVRKALARRGQLR